jgi:hypothetical protein
MVVSVAPRPLKYSHSVGNLALTGRGFSNPVDLTIASGGALYVLNRSNAAQASQGAVRVTICTADEEYIGTMAGFGEEDGMLVWPTAITHDSQGNIYISDEHRNDVRSTYSSNLEDWMGLEARPIVNGNFEKFSFV